MNSRIDVKKTKKRLKKVCAPHKEDDSVSCFDKDTLINMIKNHNKILNLSLNVRKVL